MRLKKRILIPIAAGLTGAVLLAGSYFGIVSLAESPKHALDLFWRQVKIDQEHVLFTFADDGDGSDGLDEPADFQSLLTEIALLDRSAEDGEIESEPYQQRRSVLVAQAKILIKSKDPGQE